MDQLGGYSLKIYNKEHCSPSSSDNNISCLDKDLITEGYSIKRIINYSALPIEELDEKFIELLKSSMPEIVFIYSQNSAKNFFKLIFSF